MIDKGIDIVTLEADEGMRKVQREAVKIVIDPRSSKEKEHTDNMIKNFQDTPK